MLRHCRRFCPEPRGRSASALLIFVWLLCGRARAYEEEATIDVAAGYVQRSANAPLPGSGAEVSAGAAMGISDLFVLRGALGVGAQVGQGEAHPVGRVRAEMGYLIDVVRVVPFFGVGAGAWLFEAGGLNLRPEVHGLVGIDYLWSRAWTVGLDLRPGITLVDGGSQGTFEAQLRWSRVYDLF